MLLGLYATNQQKQTLRYTLRVAGASKASHTSLVSPCTLYRHSGEKRRVTYQEYAHWKHTRGNTFLACVAAFHIWKITRDNASMLGQSLLSLSRPALFLPWFPWFVVRRLKAKKARPELLRIMMHSQRIICFVNVCHKLRLRSYRQIWQCCMRCGDATLACDPVKQSVIKHCCRLAASCPPL